MKILFFVTIFIATATTCIAETQRNVSTYKKHMASQEHRAGNFDHDLHHMLFLTGIGDTYHFLNRQRINSGNQALYCQPEGLVLSGQDYKKLFETFINNLDTPESETLEIPEAMLLALQKKFPCP